MALAREKDGRALFFLVNFSFIKICELGGEFVFCVCSFSIYFFYLSWCLVCFHCFERKKKVLWWHARLYVMNNGKLSNKPTKIASVFFRSHVINGAIFLLHALLQPLFSGAKYRFHYTHWDFIVLTLPSVFSYLTGQRLTLSIYIYHTAQHNTICIYIYIYCIALDALKPSTVVFSFDLNNLLSVRSSVGLLCCCLGCHRHCYIQASRKKNAIFFRRFFSSLSNCILFCEWSSSVFRSLRFRFPSSKCWQIYSILKIMYFHSVLYSFCVVFEFADKAAGVPFCPSIHYGHNNMETGLSHLFASLTLAISLSCSHALTFFFTLITYK